jgi:DNA polymerase I
MPKPIILIDGSSYLFRAFFAMPHLTSPDGKPTGAILGVMNMLRRLLKDYDPEYVGMIFDPKGKNFRHEMYPDYKANRSAMPDDLRVQIAPLFELIKVYGFPLIVEDGVEADDVIGTLATRLAGEGHDVLISTGDKDITQLVNSKIKIVDTMKNVVMDDAYIFEKFGVHPKQMIDFLALVGDTSDNVPGVPKVGPKTAAKWLGEYKTLDNVVAHKGDIGGKVGEYLRDNLEQLALSKELVTIKLDCETSHALETFALQAPDKTVMLEHLKQWGLTSWIKAFESVDEVEREPVVKSSYEKILTKDQWKTWVTLLRKSKAFAFDTETTSKHAMQASLVGMSFSVEGKACYVPLKHHYLDVPDQLDMAVVLQDLQPIFDNPKILKIGQNIKYDLQVLVQKGCVPKAPFFDTMLASYVLESGLTRHNLDDLAKRHLNIETTHFDEVVGKGAKQKTFDEVDVDTATHYAAEDADVTFKLYQHFSKHFESEPELKQLFEEEEMPVMEVLNRMEQLGVSIDEAELAQQSKALGTRIEAITQEAYTLAGQAFNLGSPKQLQEILYDKMELPVKKKTPKGQPSTNEEALKDLALDYPLPKIILENRHLSKLKSTYTDKLPLQVLSRTNRIHTNYGQAIAGTGRLSSSEPNLQNIPIRTEIGRKIRQAFVAPEGCVLVSADYSQVELRIMAHLSKDKKLCEAFAAGEDIHRATAAEVGGVSLIEVTSEMRRKAKAVNFGLIYGMGAFGLAKQLGVSRKEAQEYVNTYFARYPGIKTYMESTREQAKELGYVETLYHRRLYLPAIRAKNGMLRAGAERAAINAPMQGTAADVIKRAMIDIDAWLRESGLDIKMIMQVHDELIFEVPEALLVEAKAQIRKRMEGAARLDVPLIVDIGVGPNWDEAH